MRQKAVSEDRKNSHLRMFASGRTIFFPTSVKITPRQNEAEALKHLQQNMQLQTCNHIQLSFIINVKRCAKMGRMVLASFNCVSRKFCGMAYFAPDSSSVPRSERDKFTHLCHIQLQMVIPSSSTNRSRRQSSSIAHVRCLKLDSINTTPSANGQDRI